jgi:hypothetical protein
MRGLLPPGIAAAAILLAVLASSVAAEADEPATGSTFLPGPARAIPRTTSASRDAPVIEYAFGPRAQASIGLEPGLAEWRRRRSVLRVGFYAMAGLENATSQRVFPPGELWQGLVGASVSLELPAVARAWLPPGSTLEASLVVGHESDHATSASSSTLAPPGPWAIPFGGGGNFIAPDLAARLHAARALDVIVRLQDRIYFNELPLIVGARVASDTVADGLHEGLLNAPGADVIVEWRAASRTTARLAVFGEHLFAHDAFVPDGGFLRAMAGMGFAGRAGVLEPFVSFDGGNGKGLLVQERALRLSVGVRYAPF